MRSQTMYNRHIIPFVIKDKEKYYDALGNIEGSWSGRGDVFRYCNAFIRESEILLANAINLFELGYFDNAYYSLRTAVELSTTIVFLSDMPEEKKENYFKSWRTGAAQFPFHGKMIHELVKTDNNFADMKSKMSSFFDSARELSEKINKYVHKQGFKHFYVLREQQIYRNDERMVAVFEYYLKKCIGIVAVMRLAIDPFPVLLMDDEIRLRCFDSLTEPYSDDFVAEYIGDRNIEDYKTTEIFLYAYEHFIKQEKKLESVYDVIHSQYINTQKFDELFSQLHLMTYNNVFCVSLVYFSEKIVKIYCENGLDWYFTDRNTNRISKSYSSLDMMMYEKCKLRYNQIYDEVFISVFNIKEKPFLVEHNEKFSDVEIENLNSRIEDIKVFINKWE